MCGQFLILLALFSPLCASRASPLTLPMNPSCFKMYVFYPTNHPARPSLVKVVVKTDPHDNFTRDGSNLQTELPISLTEALSGFTRSIQLLNGTFLALNKTGVRGEGTAPAKVTCAVTDVSITQKHDITSHCSY